MIIFRSKNWAWMIPGITAQNIIAQWKEIFRCSLVNTVFSEYLIIIVLLTKREYEVILQNNLWIQKNVSKETISNSSCCDVIEAFLILGGRLSILLLFRTKITPRKQWYLMKRPYPHFPGSVASRNLRLYSQTSLGLTLGTTSSH